MESAREICAERFITIIIPELKRLTFSRETLKQKEWG